MAEALAPFRGTGDLQDTMLQRGGTALTLVELHFTKSGELVDLDSPQTLTDTHHAPSQVATNARAVTQAYAERLFDERPQALGLRWWSTLEASLINVTLYDRAAPSLRFVRATSLARSHPAVVEAADLLGLMRRRR